MEKTVQEDENVKNKGETWLHEQTEGLHVFQQAPQKSLQLFLKGRGVTAIGNRIDESQENP